MSVLLAVPCYGSMLHCQTALSIVSILHACGANGVEVDLLVTAGESAITRGRSNMAATFLRTHHDTLAFLDADCALSGDDFLRLLALDRPVRGAAVSLKTLDHAEMLSCYLDGERLTRHKLLNLGMFVSHPDQVAENIATNQPVRVDYLGGAAMMIEREVLLALWKKHPELEYEDPINGPGVHVFQELVLEGALLTEDYSFCRRARDAGFTIWCDPAVMVSHFEGRMAWRF